MGAYNKICYVVLLCVLLFEESIQEKPIMKVPASSIEKVRSQVGVCAGETGVPGEIIQKIIFDWPIPKDEPTKKFLWCIALNCGYCDGDGHLFIEKFADLQVGSGTREDFTNTIKECNKITLENNLSTIYAVADCVHGHYAFIPV